MRVTMLGNYVKALALAHRQVVEARGCIMAYEALSLRLIEIGHIEAAAEVMSCLERLVLNLEGFEVILVQLSSSVCDAFTALNCMSSPISRQPRQFVI
jgi:hypothetical protein